MILIQLLLALLVGGAVLAVGLSLIVGILAGVASLVLIGLCAALAIYIVKVNWKPLATGYFSFTSKDGAFVGKPGIAMNVWKLQQGNTCAINAQRMVLAICGIHKSESELAQRHQAYGLHTQAGSTDIENLMSGYGLAVRRVGVKTKSDFVSQVFYTLRAGRMAVISVNAALLNLPDPQFRTSRRAVTNHVILLTGIRNIGGRKYRVYYTDSGVPDGVLKSVDAHVMQEAAGTSFVETPILFDGEKRLWPYSAVGLDVGPVEASGNELVIALCPQCEKSLRFKLIHESRVSCPRCSYQFVASKVKPDRKRATWGSSDWEQAGRDCPPRHERKKSADAQDAFRPRKTEAPEHGKSHHTFTEMRVNCRSCHHTFAETVLTGPTKIPLKCPNPNFSQGIIESG